MTTHIRSLFVALALIAAAFAGAYILETVAFHIGVAHAQGSGSDAGSAIAAVGSGSATSGSGAHAPSADQVPNPTADPAAYLDSLKNAKSIGWPIFILVGVYGLLELLAWIGTKSGVASLAFIGKGRITAVVSGLTGIVAAALNALAGGGTWLAVCVVAVPMAIAFFAHPAGTDPKKA